MCYAMHAIHILLVYIVLRMIAIGKKLPYILYNCGCILCPVLRPKQLIAEINKTLENRTTSPVKLNGQFKVKS